MRALVQRVLQASVSVDGREISRIGPGLLVLLGVARDDAEADAAWVARKIAALRIFEDDEEKMNRSVKDAAGEILLVSQFTLLADTKKGTRPSFQDAAPPELGERLYERCCALTEAEGVSVRKGRFGAYMQVALVNDGPVTILLDSKKGAGIA